MLRIFLVSVTERSFEKNGKEQKERNVLLKRTERTERSFEKNGKERKRTERTARSFEKNGCPTLNSRETVAGAVLVEAEYISILFVFTPRNFMKLEYGKNLGTYLLPIKTL